MISRRDAIKLGGAAAACAGFGLGAGEALAAERMWPLNAIPPGALNPTGIKVLSNTARIAVPSYRFGVVMRSGISASGGQGSVKMEAAADLVGLDLAQMRAIADAAHADFIERLRATGRPLVTAEEMAGSAGYRKLETTPVPFVKKPFADARTVVMVSPDQLPLVNQHSDSPITDKSPFSLGNWRAINQMCVDLNCVVMIPSLVIDFAQLSGSGHSVYGASAQVGIQPGLFLVPLFTQLTANHAKIALAGPIGKIILKDRVSIGQAGELVKTSSANNRAEVDWWNSVGRWDANASPLSKPGSAYDYSTYQYRVEPEIFSQACLDAAKAMNTIYAGAASENRPA
ncbi:MAG: twin-arginine translocation signal domain-containing protein [Novosphingobium sp.]